MRCEAVTAAESAAACATRTGAAQPTAGVVIADEPAGQLDSVTADTMMD